MALETIDLDRTIECRKGRVVDEEDEVAMSAADIRVVDDDAARIIATNNKKSKRNV
jgi:hypothetical protein